MENCSSYQECVKINEQKEHPEDSHCASNSSRTNKVVGDDDLTHCQPFEIPLENGDMDDFWNILGSLETPNESSHISRPRENGDGEGGNDKLLGESFEELQCKWLRNLEYELGLVAETGGHNNKMSQPDPCSIFDAQYPIF
ncbi:hypothetical protein Leryth_012638 [Lithospermum erythrorhizon]|nr:hypothetical protein Leryth_012638 [Lithospermum erythrorhizon]